MESQPLTPRNLPVRIPPVASEKSPSSTPTLGQRVPGPDGFAGGYGRAPRPCGEPSRGRVGRGAGGAAVGRPQGRPSSRTSRRPRTERRGRETDKGRGATPSCRAPPAGRREAPAACAPVTSRPPGARPLPARVRVRLSPTASGGQQRAGDEEKEAARSSAGEEAEAPRGAGSGDLNSAGVAPRLRSKGGSRARRQLRGLASGLRCLLPAWAVAAPFADRGVAAAAAASPARRNPLGAGARREGPGATRPQRALRERPGRVPNNGAERRREPRVRSAELEEVAGLRAGGRETPPLLAPGVCLRAGLRRPRAPGSRLYHRRQLEPESMVPAPGLI